MQIAGSISISFAARFRNPYSGETFKWFCISSFTKHAWM